MATDLPKRDESRYLPHIWIAARNGIALKWLARDMCFATELDAVANGEFPVEYVPISELEAVLKRVGELELAAVHAMECHERWCNCDVEELSNAMSKLDQVLAQTEKSDA